MGRPNQLHASVLEALRLIAAGDASRISPERLRELLDLGLIKQRDESISLTFPGRYRLRMVDTDSARNS